MFAAAIAHVAKNGDVSLTGAGIASLLMFMFLMGFLTCIILNAITAKR